MLVRPPAERMPSASTLPETAVTSRIADSLTPNPRPPVPNPLIALGRPAPWPAGSWDADPEPEPAVAPNLSVVLAPSIAISADSSEPRYDACVPSALELAAGVSCRNSCQRRPPAGSDSSCVAVTVVATIGSAGSAFCAAAATGVDAIRPSSRAACTPLATAAFKGRSAGDAAKPCASGSTRGTAIASAGSAAMDCVSSAALSCGEVRVAGGVDPSERIVARCGVTGCGAASSPSGRTPSASRGASVNLRIGSVPTSAIISGFAVLSAARENVASGNAEGAAAARETGALCVHPGAATSERAAAGTNAAVLGVASVLAVGFAAPGAAYAIKGIVAAVCGGTAISPGVAAASTNPLGWNSGATGSRFKAACTRASMPPVTRIPSSRPWPNCGSSASSVYSPASNNANRKPPFLPVTARTSAPVARLCNITDTRASGAECKSVSRPASEPDGGACI